ncbi:MAG: OmpA family protein [Crocinitomicaceae bacterium]|nr:OmpA family protein [Crocinitomicaceae bacterium]
MNYVVEGKKEGYFVNSLAISTEGIAQTTRIEKALTLDKQPAEAIVISDIKYDFDSPNLTQRSKNILDTTLVELFKKYPNLQFEISAHTDSKGTDAYNLKLSQKRAESVVRYLVSKGIPERQLVARGYGESLPIAPNENPDGTDNPEGREKNRRTAFKILGEIEEEIIDLQEEEE